MNQEWSAKNKQMQLLLKKNTFPEGIRQLLELRDDLMQEMLTWKTALAREDFSAMPFINADGYHSKTVAYSLWHVFRIEDIVVHSLIKNDPEVLFAEGFEDKIGAPIITTGNELYRQQIAEFSQALDLDALYQYIVRTKTSTDSWLTSLEYSDLRRRFDATDRDRLEKLEVVSADEKACWLLDYWCGKDIRGLILMPLSRHWIMHIEAALRIIKKTKQQGK